MCATVELPLVGLWPSRFYVSGGGWRYQQSSESKLSKLSLKLWQLIGGFQLHKLWLEVVTEYRDFSPVQLNWMKNKKKKKAIDSTAFKFLMIRERWWSSLPCLNYIWRSSRNNIIKKAIYLPLWGKRRKNACVVFGTYLAWAKIYVINPDYV